MCPLGDTHDPHALDTAGKSTHSANIGKEVSTSGRGEVDKTRYRHTISVLKCTQTNEQQASKGKPRERKIPLERAQMNANAFTLVKTGVVCRLLHQRPARLLRAALDCSAGSTREFLVRSARPRNWDL